jgi:DNA repair exonuclease SbcCD ATPase subunit
MKINKISASGLKCSDFSHELGDVTLFVGSNFSGKTSRLEAIRLALVGYLPEFGLVPAETMKLARNGLLEVRVETDAGTIIRTWRTGKKPFSQGEIPTIPPVLMDPSVYFSLGPKDRMRYVFGLCQTGEEAAQEIVKLVKFVGVPGEAAAKVITKITTDMDESDTIRHEQGQVVQDWMQGQVELYREQLKNARARVDMMTKQVQAGTVLADQAGSRDVQPEIDRLTAEKQTKSEQLGATGTVIQQLIAARDEIDHYQAKLNKQNDINPITQERIDWLTNLANSESGLSEIRQKLATLVGSITHGSRELEETKKRLNEMHSELDNLTETKCCPMCGGKSKAWTKVQSEKVIAYAAKMEPLTKRVKELTTQVSQWTDEEDQLKKDEIKAQLQEKEIMGARWELTGNANRIKLAAEREQLTKRLAELGDRGTIETKLQELKEKQVQISKQIDFLSTRINELDKIKRARIEAQQDAKRRAQAILQRKESEIEVEVLKAVVKALESFQVKMVEDAFASIIDRANVIASPVLKAPLCYQDGELGMRVDDHFISHESFSGLERAMCYLGISFALCDDAPIKIMLLDELGRLDHEHLQILLRHMVALVQDGTISQFVGAGILPNIPLPEGVEIIQL